MRRLRRWPDASSANISASEGLMYLRPARMVRSASSRSFASPAFEKNPLAPARSRLTAYCSSACILTMRIGRSGRRRQSMATVSTTEASGREISASRHRSPRWSQVSARTRPCRPRRRPQDRRWRRSTRESQHEPARDRLRPRCAFSACLPPVPHSVPCRHPSIGSG